MCRCLFLLAMLIPLSCLAHREDYLDETLVFLTLGRSELEPEYWFDAGRDSHLRQDFSRHNVAAEYGITEHWMVDGRASARQNAGDPLRFESGRVETRYRFGDEGDRPVDVAASLELNLSRPVGGGTEYGLEPRVIFSKDLATLNFTLNLPLEIALKDGGLSATPAFGMRYDVSEAYRFGSELKYDTEARAGAVIPQLWLGASRALTVKLGYSVPFAHNHEEYLRLALEAEF